MAPGRNDPCHCGSGLKYQKCCLPKDDAARAASRPPAAARDTAIAKLMRFIDAPEFDGFHDVAQEIFWADYLDEMDDDEFEELSSSDDVQVKYAAWLLWDIPVEQGATFADLFVQRRWRSLDSAERAYIDRMRQSYLSLYQIEDVQPGVGVGLHDLLTKERVFVRERIGTEQMVRWDILGARVVGDEQGIPRFEGGIYLYAVADKDAIVRDTKRWRRKYLREFPNTDYRSFLKHSGMLFNYLWLDYVVFRPKPQMTTAEGDAMVFTKSFFDVADPGRLEGVFDLRDDLDPVENASYLWIDIEDESSRILGTWRLDFDDERLVLETMSRERDKRGREWLASVAPGLATYRATDIETVEQALRNRPAAAIGPNPERGPEIVEAERQLQDEYYRQWLDDPIPALRGATPREAAASRKLRPLLLDLLRELENRTERSKRNDPDAYDPGWLWTELGLERG
jgi:hypothetical protein